MQDTVTEYGVRVDHRDGRRPFDSKVPDLDAAHHYQRVYRRQWPKANVIIVTRDVTYGAWGVAAC